MMIQAFHLTKVHPSGVKVLEDAVLSFADGSFTVVIGESRTGKSTFLKMIGGEEKPTSGVLRVDHLDLYSLPPREKQKWLSEVGMIFPDLQLFSDKTVEENILFALQAKSAGLEGGREAVRQLLSRAGLGSKASLKPQDLSSGEQRMVMALRAMIFSPRLLLADDPFQGLDPHASSILYRFLLELNKTGCTVVLTTPQRTFWEEAQKASPESPIHLVQLEGGKLFPLESAL